MKNRVIPTKTRPETGTTTARMSSAAWLMIAFVSGAGVMMLEITAPRLLQPYFGASTFVWTNIIGVVLAALSIGYWLGARMVETGAPPVRVANILILGGGLSALAIVLVRPLALWLLPDPVILIRVPDALWQTRTGSLVVTLVLFAPAIIALAAVTPLLVKLAAREGDPPGRAAGRVLAAGTAGSLLGTFLPTYIFIPYAGSRLTILTAALILLASGVVVWLCAKPKTGRPWLIVLSIIFILIGIVGSRSTAHTLNDGQELLDEGESAYQYWRVVRERTDIGAVRRLQINEGTLAFQSVLIEGSDITNEYYDYLALMPALVDSKDKLAILILGGGGGTLPRLLYTHWAGRIGTVVNVEIDPQIARLHHWFDFDPPKGYENIVADGRAFLRSADQKFDLIYIDAYTRQSDIPFHLGTAEFFQLARDALKPAGVVALNISTRNHANALLQGLAKAMGQNGHEVWTFPVRNVDNAILWASNRVVSGDLEYLAAVPTALQSAARHTRRFASKVSVLPNAPDFSDDRAPLAYLARRRLQ